MEVNKKQLADIFGASIRTIQNWQEQGMPVLRGGGKGNEVLYDSAAVIKWYAERDAEIENEKLRREVEELRQASETDLQPGTIEYERHRLTRAQADAQELKNARDSAEVVETAFCTFVLSRIAGEIASILDGIPLSVQRRFPELENRHVDFLKRDIIKAMNKAAALDELITDVHEETKHTGYVLGSLRIRESVSKIGGKIGKRLGHEKQWSLHDLRRTLSTHLSDLGVEFYVVEQLLGHALPGVAGVYNRSKFMAKKLDALELWTTYLNSIAGADSKVTILKQKAG
ncbi:terminase small subunit [Escherichia coli]